MPGVEPEGKEARSTIQRGALSGDPDSLLSHYRDLIRLRNEHPALRFGELLPVETGARPVVAYLRTVGDDRWWWATGAGTM